MMVTRAVAGSQKGASGAPNWVTGDSPMLVVCSFFLAHRQSGLARGHCLLVALRVGRCGTQRAVATDYKVRLDITGLEYLPGESDGVLLTEFLAGTDVDIDFAILRPGVQA